MTRFKWLGLLVYIGALIYLDTKYDIIAAAAAIVATVGYEIYAAIKEYEEHEK